MGIELLYGTGNEGKLEAMRKHLSSLDIRIIGLQDIDTDIPEIDESGNDPLKNARIKGMAYYKATGRPVFSCDSGLYIKGAQEDIQPGVHVRNVGGRRLSDEEMIEHYSRLAHSMGGQMTVRYKNGICLIMGDNEIYQHMGDDIAGEEFLIVSKPHSKRTPGFPLDSLSVHIKTGKYYYDMEEFENRSSMDEGFRRFFKESLGLREPKMDISIDLRNYQPGGSVFKRTAARGIIRREDKYLMIHSRYGDYKFPGGGMNLGETTEQTLIREVREETGYLVIPGSIEYFGMAQERRKGAQEDILEMESFYYLCEVGEAPGERELDKYEAEYGYKVCWITLEKAMKNNKSCSDFDACPWVERDVRVMELLQGL